MVGIKSIMKGYNQAYIESHQTCAMSGEYPVEFHHCLYKRMKRFPELNAPENLLPLTKKWHAIFEAGGYEYRCKAWQMKVEEYGAQHMTDWHDKLPMKVKERFG